MNRLIAGVAIILEQDSKVLLAKRAPHRFAGGIWEFPAGRLEIGESLDDVIIREAQEELGLDVTPVQLIHAYIFDRENKALILLNYYCKFAGEPRISNEHEELRWVNFDEAMILLKFPQQKETLQKYLSIRNCL